jgi:O-antigen/teichoic acid export membrane protein
MNIDIKKYKDAIKKLFNKGFFHVAGSNILNRLITAITNILIARFLGKYDYGVFGAAYNIYSIFIIFSGLGMTGAILVYCSENRTNDKKKAYYKYGLISGFIASIALSLGMLLYGAFTTIGIIESHRYIILLSMLPLLDYVMQYFLVIFRSQKQNEQYAKYINVASFSYLVLGCVGARFWGITGTILGRYISYLIVIVVTIKPILPYVKVEASEHIRLGKKKTKELWSFSIKNGISSALNQILYLIDVALISALILDAEVVASYKVAILIPEGLSFIPSSLMIFLVPIIAEHNTDGKWLRQNTKKIILYSGIMNVLISVVLFFLAPYIICLLWGSEYLDSVPCFRILAINYFFMATFRMPCTNILAVLHKVNFNLWLGIAAGILDIVLDYVLIINLGAVGAALATISTVLFISFISVPYLIKSLRVIE